MLRCMVDPTANRRSYTKHANYTTDCTTDFVITGYLNLDDLKIKQFYQVSTEHAIQLSLKYDSYKMYSWVFKLDPFSFDTVRTMWHMQADRIFGILYKYITKYITVNINKYIYTLGVSENNKRAYHMHFVALAPRYLSKTDIQKIKTYISNIDIHLLCSCELERNDMTVLPDSLFNPTPIECDIMHDGGWRRDAAGYHTKHIILLDTYQQIKSTSSFINYLRKNPYQIFHANLEIGEYFVNYNPTHVFAANTYAKYANEDTIANKQILTSKPIVLLFFKLFRKGEFEYNDVLRNPTVQEYLHIPNLKAIYQNCIQQFLATQTHVKNLLCLMENFLAQPIENCCACPMFEWLDSQQIDTTIFMRAITEWLNGVGKKNALYLQGIPNAGKSHVARLIWKQLLFNRRIVQDGIFTFANCLNSGCMLWDEPFVSPDLADTTKLILEGTPDVNIVRKNEASAKLGKRVPIIITSNTIIYKYCSGERQAFEERYFHFSCNRAITEDMFCSSTNNHFCMYLDSANSTTSPFGNQLSNEISLGPGETTPREKTCQGLHRLLEHHVLTFLVRCLIVNLEHLKPFDNTTKEDEQTLYDLIVKCKDRCCFMSKNLLNRALIE